MVNFKYMKYYTEEETIDDKYGVAVVFHDDEEEVGTLFIMLILINAHHCCRIKATRHQ